jgi:hypothetical protein
MKPGVGAVLLTQRGQFRVTFDTWEVAMAHKGPGQVVFGM